MTILGAAALAIALAAPLAASADATFFVSPRGADANPGTKARPFATPQRARDALRNAKPGERRSVVLLGGTYELREPLVLGAQDSGTAQRPVVWQAAKGEAVHLIGGRSVPTSAFRPVDDAGILPRLDPSARGHVLCADLKALGIAVPAFPKTYHGAPPGPELFFGGKRMSLAHWPNEGWTTIDKIVDNGSNPREGDKGGKPGAFTYAGDRPARWRAEEGVWLQGYWCFDWYDEVIQVASIDPATKRITLAAPHLYSVKQGNPSPRRFRALNVLEELDTPGEFYIDRGAGALYFWPPSDIAASPVVLSMLAAPLISMEEASHVTVRGLTVEAGLADGIEVKDGEDCRIEDCDVTNLRGMGIVVRGGQRHRVTGCDIHETGTGGLVLEGGNRKTLTPSHHEAVDNHIWRFSVHQLTGAYGLSFGGVGNRAAHNVIHDAPHQAIFVGGNDHVFELNEVYRVCTETDDCGALYKGRNPSCRGNVIRFNYWHEVGSKMGHGSAAVYFDDGDGGDLVFGNVFLRCGDPGRGSFGTVFSHGGHDNRAENNVFIECKRALGSAPWNDARWRAALKGAEETFYPEKLLKEVDITKPPYTTRYPELVGFMDPPPNAKRVNRAKLNVLVRCGEATSGWWEFPADENLVTDADPGFVDAARGNYRLRKGAPVFAKLKGFVPIPFDQIGLTHGRRERPMQPPMNTDTHR